MRYYIGIDNGVTGSVGIISEDKSVIEFFETPVIKQLNYQKSVKNINRVIVPELREKLALYQSSGNEIVPLAIVERPMVNPTRFDASTSALRALEATLIVLEGLKIPYRFIDSKEWQKQLLPKGLKGSDKLKKASYDVGHRLFPDISTKIHKDFDGLLIAEYARLNSL